jgi:hypothetical protein
MPVPRKIMVRMLQAKHMILNTFFNSDNARIDKSLAGVIAAFINLTINSGRQIMPIWQVSH